MNYKIIPKKVRKSGECLICKGKNLVKFLSLGKTALANAYLKENDLDKLEFKVPLDVYYCEDCYLVQLLDIVDRGLLFRDYAYFSSTSPQLFDHFDKYAAKVMEKFPNQAKKLILEIASNDGILLKAFKKRGARVLGIDPAKNIARMANSQGIETIGEFFNSVTAKKIKEQYGCPGVITANNVLAHTDILPDILAGVKTILAPDGVFVSQSKYLLDLLNNNQFDTVYHEHISYFSLLSTMKALEIVGLKVVDVEHVETEGGSLRVYATHESANVKVKESVQNILLAELSAGLDKTKTYLQFSTKPKTIKKQLGIIFKDLMAKKARIVGYGASAKGNTLLQFCGLDSSMIEYITDNNVDKQGKFTPGTHILIDSPKKLRQSPPDYIFVIAWNFADDIIRNREKWFGDSGGKFIVPIPSPRII